jgi:hypothetical protein
MPTATSPRILFEGDLTGGDGWRIVRVVVPEQARQDPTDDGVRDLIEVSDGVDLMGARRWQKLDGKTGTTSTLVRVCHALKEELLKGQSDADHGECD